MTGTTKPAAVTGQPTNALGVEAFRYLWLSSVTFYLVSNALRFVYGWVVLDGLDRGEAWQGIVVFMFGVPSFFLLMPSGVWADRLDPKRMLLATQVAMMCVMFGTAVAIGSGTGSLAILIVSALLAGSASSLGFPLRSSLIPSLLSGDLLYSGIALNAIGITLSLVLGAVSAEFVGDHWGFDGAFYYLAALMLVGIAALSRLVSPGPATKGDRVSMRKAMGVGVAFVWNDLAIRLLFLLLGVSGLIMSPIMFVTIQAHIKEELGLDAGDAAPAIALMGVGIALSSFVIMRRGNMKNKSVLFMRAMLCGTALLMLIGQTTAYWQVLVLSVFVGMCGGFFINMNQGLIQANTPSEVMGRVMGLYALVQAGLSPLGALILGVTASAIGTGTTITVAAGLGFAVVMIVYLRAPAIRRIN